MKFYEDELNIEMLRKADEIQADKPDPEYAKFVTDEDGWVIVDEQGNFWDNTPLLGTAWLPRLDQLVEMLDIPLQKLLTDIYHWDCGGLGAGWPTGMDHSWEVMFLGYLMETKFKKKWDFEKREWVSLP